MMLTWGKMVATEEESRFWVYFEGTMNRFCQMNQLWGMRERRSNPRYWACGTGIIELSQTDVEETLGGANVVCYQENELFLKSVALLYLLVSQCYHSKLAHTW